MSKQDFMLLGLVSQTSVHAGSGDTDGAVDLPIQREAHTGYPVVYGSSLKGAMRAAADLRSSSQALVNTLFGPEHLGKGATADQIFAGSWMVSDARLLWLPIRSLTTHTRLVTCPAILRRLSRDVARVGAKALPGIDSWQAKTKDATALVATACDSSLYLEEYRFKTEVEPEVGKWAETLAAFHPDMAAELKQQLTVISDDMFAHLCSAAIPVHPHIAIDSKTKTVLPGALWYEESLPPETGMYVLLGATASRSGTAESASALLNSGWEMLFGATPYLQVGANETTGMGWFHVTRVEG
ncbi:MAG: type III-B CRISPR module RAMP protein Cmr4 [Corallincola sp.]|nr:type III-B CRISPR module RAMP protein Cmr4 [Corallincola sp.]